MEWRSIIRIAALVVAVPTSAVLIYRLLLLREEEDEEGQNTTKVDRSRQTVIQITIPNKAVGTVIGSKGTTIKKIQEETGARVNFSDRSEAERDKDNEQERTVYIRGDPESAQKAEIMVRQIVADIPAVVTEEILVPGYCVGRLIGRGGQTISGIHRASKCMIMIDRSQDSDPEGPRKVTITGPCTNMSLAKSLIKEKVVEEEEFRSRKAAEGADREQRKIDKQDREDRKEALVLPSRVVEKEESWEAGDQQSSEIPEAEPLWENTDVFVSAVEHCGHFWVQMVDTVSGNLDAMTDEMIEFYSNPDTVEKYKLKEVKEGDVVAAPLSADWYRARVEGFEDGKIDVYYFDFGDSGYLPLESLRELKPEFHSLPIQAVECKLANVAPVGGEWSEESMEWFEGLTHSAEWKVMSSTIVGYETIGSEQRPCLKLVDGSTGADVAKEMVARGFAVWDPSLTSAPASADAAATTSPSNATTTAITGDTPITAAAAAAAATAVVVPDTVRPEPVPVPVPDPDPS